MWKMIGTPEGLCRKYLRKLGEQPTWMFLCEVYASMKNQIFERKNYSRLSHKTKVLCIGVKWMFYISFNSIFAKWPNR